MRVIFIADAHLRSPSDNNYQLMLKFLGELPGRVEMLIIAGDFFEFWLGDSPEEFPHYKPVLDALEKLTNCGIKLIFIEGNHDFHLQKYFSSAFNADVSPNAITINLDGKKLFICHGDLINMKDYGYRALRFLFHNPVTKLLANILPASIPASIANRLGNHSKGNHKAAAEKWDSKQLTRSFAAKYFTAGYDVVIAAHYHRPFLEETDNKCLLSLGDWITQFSYGEWLDGELTLKRYAG